MCVPIKSYEEGNNRSHLWLQCNLMNVLEMLFVFVKLNKLIYYASISQNSFTHAMILTVEFCGRPLAVE